MRTRALALAVVLAGCGGDGIDDPGDAGDVLDVRAEIPEAPTQGLQFVTPEIHIAPHSEEMFCIALDPLAEDIAVVNSASYQGQYGHHLVVLTRTVPAEAGSVVRCSDPKDMWMYSLGLRPGSPHPEGMAEKLAAGVQLMVQTHYVNTSAHELLVRDVLNIYTMPMDEVQTWMGGFAHANIDFSIPRNVDYQVELDCSFDRDVNLIEVFPHMHEWGTHSEIYYGAQGVTRTEDMTLLYEVPTWRVEFRDVPPSRTFPVDAPMQIHAGDHFRTVCHYYNDSDHDILFPEEMCVTAGAIYPYQGNMICGGTPD